MQKFAIRKTWKKKKSTYFRTKFVENRNPKKLEEKRSPRIFGSILQKIKIRKNGKKKKSTKFRMKFAAYRNPKKLEEKNLHGFSDHICIKFRIRKTWKEKKSTQISEKICRKFLPPKFVPPNLKSEKFWQPGTGLWSGAGSSPGSGAEVDCAYSTIYWIPFMQNILQLATIFFRQLHK